MLEFYKNCFVDFSIGCVVALWATEMRNMNFGFNSNVTVKKTIYHVQTEDRGPAHPYVDTVVYEAGKVVHKLSTDYRNVSGGAKPEDLPAQLHDLLSKQHRAVIAQLEAGTLEFSTISSVPAEGPAPSSREGIDVRLLNPKTWLQTGNVTLEVELCQKGTTEPICDGDIESFLEADKVRSVPVGARPDAGGRATLKFRLPATVAEGTSLVIRATDGSLYGELRFRLKARRNETAPVEPSK